MRNEMDRVFERFEHGWPRWHTLFRRDAGITVLEPTCAKTPTRPSLKPSYPASTKRTSRLPSLMAMLTIKGEKKHEKEEKGETYHMSERSYGSFERSIRLPDAIDDAKVEAKFDKGF